MRSAPVLADASTTSLRAHLCGRDASPLRILFGLTTSLRFLYGWLSSGTRDECPAYSDLLDPHHSIPYFAGSMNLWSTDVHN